MKIIKLSHLVVWLLCCAAVVAQTKKLDKTFKSNSDVTVDVDATHTNVVVEQWDQDKVQISAFLDMPKAKEDELNEALKNWKLGLDATTGEISITSSGGVGVPPDVPMPPPAAPLAPLAELPEIMAPLHEMVGPLLESISGNPLPPELLQGMSEMEFDFEAYKQEGDEYLEQWEAKVEKNFGKDFEKSMEEWAAKMEKDSALIKRRAREMEEMEKEMEAWGEEFEKNMEAWGEKFGKDMEAWAENLEKQVEAKYGDSENRIIVINTNGKAKRTLKIKMPQNAQLKLNVRHGDVKLSGNTKNLSGTLSHSTFSAEEISGEETDLRVSFTPVKVEHWDYGMLNASYVQDLKMNTVRSIKLTSNSSEVAIGQLEDNGIFRGTFGELVIEELDRDFDNVDIILENSDLRLDLPDVSYRFSYSGNRSQIDYPEGLTVKSNASYDNQKLNGYNKNKSSDAAISITASFSDILLK